MPDLRVSIDRDARIEMPDGSAWYGVRVQVFMASSRSASGWKYIAFMVDSSDALVQPEDRFRYSHMAAYALAKYEQPATRWEAELLESTYMDLIDTQLMEAVYAIA